MGLKNLPAQKRCKTQPPNSALEPLLPAQLETFRTQLHIQVQIRVQKPQPSRNAGTLAPMRLQGSVLSQGHKPHTSEAEPPILNQFQNPHLQPHVLNFNPADALLLGPGGLSLCIQNVCLTSIAGLPPPCASGSVVWWSGVPASEPAAWAQVPTSLPASCDIGVSYLISACLGC